MPLFWAANYWPQLQENRPRAAYFDEKPAYFFFIMSKNSALTWWRASCPDEFYGLHCPCCIILRSTQTQQFFATVPDLTRLMDGRRAFQPGDVQGGLRVARALNSFVDDYPCGCRFSGAVPRDGQRTTFFQVTGRAEALGALQGVGVHTAGQHLCFGSRHHGVVGAGQTGDRVQQDHDVFSSLRPGAWPDDHFRSHSARGGWRVRREGRRHHFTAHRALYFCHFSGRSSTADNHDGVGVVGGDGCNAAASSPSCRTLGLATIAALPMPMGRTHPGCGPSGSLLLLMSRSRRIVRPVQRRQVFEHDAMLDFGRHAVDLSTLTSAK